MTFDFDKIVSAPAPRPILPGSHCEIAERYRQAALQSSARLRLVAEMLDQHLRERPDDDAIADQSLREIMTSLRACAAWIDAFRATRIIDGEA